MNGYKLAFVGEILLCIGAGFLIAYAVVMSCMDLEHTLIATMSSIALAIEVTAIILFAVGMGISMHNRN